MNFNFYNKDQIFNFFLKNLNFGHFDINKQNFFSNDDSINQKYRIVLTTQNHKDNIKTKIPLPTAFKLNPY